MCRSFALVLAAIPATLAQATDLPNREVLPETVIPTHYDLVLSPEIEALTFRGTVAISVEAKASVQDIVLNADGLVFDRVTVDGEGALTVEADRKLGRETLHAKQPITAGRHLVTEIAFGDGPPAGAGPYLLLPLALNHPDLVWDLALSHLEDPAFPLDNRMRWKITVFVAGKSALLARETALKTYEARNVPEDASAERLG
jgi:hypothetical protein